LPLNTFFRFTGLSPVKRLFYFSFS